MEAPKKEANLLKNVSSTTSRWLD